MGGGNGGRRKSVLVLTVGQRQIQCAFRNSSDQIIRSWPVNWLVDRLTALSRGHSHKAIGAGASSHPAESIRETGSHERPLPAPGFSPETFLSRRLFALAFVLFSISSRSHSEWSLLALFEATAPRKSGERAKTAREDSQVEVEEFDAVSTTYSTQVPGEWAPEVNCVI